MDEIAAELDVTKASIYYYFETKEELLYEVHLLSMQQVTERLERILERGGPPVELLQDAIREHLRLLDSDYEVFFSSRSTSSRRTTVKKYSDCAATTSENADAYIDFFLYGLLAR